MEKSGSPVNYIACDSITPWALDLAHQIGLKGMAISATTVVVAALYYHFEQGTLSLPPKDGIISLPSLPAMVESDLPSPLSDPTPYPELLESILTQNRSLLVADWFLVNSFDTIEAEILSWMPKEMNIKTIGPLLPSNNPENKLDIGISLFEPADDDLLTQWLDSKDPASVVYVACGSMSDFEQDQMHELSFGLANSQCNFLWVVHDTEQSKLPSNFQEEIKGRGLIVHWCSQLKVLAHPAVGCTLTHCGWNSMLEALSVGLPMVAMPQWVDQSTNAKFIVDVWQFGIQAKAGENGLVGKGEVERCVKEVLEGESRRTLQENALKWNKLSNEALNGGSSEKNIEDFILDLYKLSSSSV